MIENYRIEVLRMTAAVLKALPIMVALAGGVGGDIWDVG